MDESKENKENILEIYKYIANETEICPCGRSEFDEFEHYLSGKCYIFENLFKNFANHLSCESKKVFLERIVRKGYLIAENNKFYKQIQNKCQSRYGVKLEWLK